MVPAATADDAETDPRRVADPAFFALIAAETSGQTASEAVETQRILTELLRGGDGDRLDDALRPDLIRRRDDLLAMLNMLRVELALLDPGESDAAAAETAARWRIDTLGEDGSMPRSTTSIDVSNSSAARRAPRPNCATTFAACVPIPVCRSSRSPRALRCRR